MNFTLTWCSICTIDLSKFDFYASFDKLGFTFYLAKNNIELSLRKTHYGSSYILNGFIDMDTNHCKCNLSYSMFTSSHNSKIDMNL